MEIVELMEVIKEVGSYQCISITLHAWYFQVIFDAPRLFVGSKKEVRLKKEKKLWLCPDVESVLHFHYVILHFLGGSLMLGVIQMNQARYLCLNFPLDSRQ